MRAGDIMWLRPEHVDFETALIGIWQGKSKHPRLVPMATEVRELLETWPMDGEYVYPCEYKCTPQVRSPRPVKLFNIWLKNHGFHFTHKSLRHFWVNQLRRLGLDLSARKLIAGHQDDATNLIYTHPLVEETRPYVEQVLLPAVAARPKAAGRPAASA
jgi:integrase